MAGTVVRGGRPGPVYDTALRRLMERDLTALGALIGVPVSAQARILSAKLPVSTLEADLLISPEPGHLIHVEYARTGTPDLAARMLVYRGLIVREHPSQRLTQYVIVLGDGRVRSHPDLRDLESHLTVIYLRDLDPATLLSHPGLVPLAVLGHATPEQRVQVFTDSVGLIRSHGGPRLPENLEFAGLLASIRLDPTTIERIIEEAGMTAESIAEFFRPTKTAQLLLNEGREEGREEGLTAGREEGLTAGRTGVLAYLLRDRFGDHPDLTAVAHQLATWPDASTAVRAITDASSFADVLATPPPA
jgi:hypothetical protein